MSVCLASNPTQLAGLALWGPLASQLPSPSFYLAPHDGHRWTIYLDAQDGDS